VSYVASSNIVTLEAVGTTWKVSRELVDSRGLAFIQEYLSGYDLSEVEWITVRLGSWGFHPNSRWTNATHGLCRHPWGSSSTDKYRLNTNVNTRKPFPLEEYATVNTPHGKRKVPYILNDEHEAVVSIVAHEASHYLGYTNQVPCSGRGYEVEGYGWVNTTNEIEAGAFEKAAVEAYRNATAQPPIEFELEPTVTEPATVKVPDEPCDPWLNRCVVCGRDLPRSTRRRFCSDEHRYAFHNRRRHDRTAAGREKTCQVCGRAFTAGNALARYCSDACRQKAYRER
jgi:predicted nucleic acid-binding Zn ribbon protein